jgi:hypothetical protein
MDQKNVNHIIEKRNPPIYGNDTGNAVEGFFGEREKQKGWSDHQQNIIQGRRVLGYIDEREKTENRC